MITSYWIPFRVQSFLRMYAMIRREAEKCVMLLPVAFHTGNKRIPEYALLIKGINALLCLGTMSGSWYHTWTYIHSTSLIFNDKLLRFSHHFASVSQLQMSIPFSRKILDILARGVRQLPPFTCTDNSVQKGINFDYRLLILSDTMYFRRRRCTWCQHNRSNRGIGLLNGTVIWYASIPA